MDVKKISYKKWQEAAEKLVNSLIEGNPTKNFDRVAVNIYPIDELYIYVQISFLYKKPFGEKDLDLREQNKDKFRRYIESFLPIVDSRIHFSFNSETIENYETKSLPYYERMREKFN